MNTPMFRRWVLFLFGVMAVAILVVFLLHSIFPATKPPVAIETPRKEEPQPSLNCAFYDFMHARIIIGFDFAVAFPNGQQPIFYERSEGSDTTATITFDAKRRPIWTFGRDDDGTPTIKSPDGATLIVLYGLKLGTPGALRIEAGVRSNDYRNLGGECRQVDFDSRGAVPTSAP